MIVKFKTENAAFEDDLLSIEVARILRKIADSIEDGKEWGKVMDINGNTVGEWSL